MIISCVIREAFLATNDLVSALQIYEEEQGYQTEDKDERCSKASRPRVYCDWLRFAL